MSRASVEIGIGPVAPEQVIAVAREDAAVTIDPGALEAIQQSRAAVERLAEVRARVRRVHRFRCVGHETHRARVANATPEVAGALARGRQRTRSRAGSGAGDDAAAVVDPRHRPTPESGRRRRRPWPRCPPTASRRSSREHGSLGCSGDLAPLAHCALAVMGEGTVRDATGKLCPAAEGTG